MGKTSLSLPDEMLMELELAAEKNGRTFSGEVRFRLVELDLLKTTPVALSESASANEILRKKKIAEGIPLVKVASDLEIANGAGWFPSLAANTETGRNTETAKKRPEITDGAVELIKGFWRERFDNVGDAIIEAEQKGWKEGEYEIKPL